MIGVHILHMAVPTEWKIEMILLGGVIPSRLTELTHFEGLPPIGAFLSATFPLFAYNFLHANLMHIGFNSVWLLTFGGGVGRRLGGDVAGSYRFFVLFFAGGLAGAMAHVLFHPQGMAPLVGASAGVSAMMGAAIRFIFIPMQINERRMPIYVPLTDYRLLVFSGVFIAANVFIGLFSMSGVPADASIAWEAHIGGYLAGLFLFPILDRR